MQYLVRVGGGQERLERFAWLEEQGIQNVHKLDDVNYRYDVVVVEEKRFFGGNVTCFACAGSCGQKVIGWEEFLTLYEKHAWTNV